MTLLTTLKAGLVAAALGVGTFAAAAPAMAAPPPPNFSFSFNFGNGGGPGMYFNYGGRPRYLCLSDQQIVWQLQNYGFRSVRIVRSRGYEVIVVARWHGDWYQLLVNRCNGRIVQRPVDYFPPGPRPGPGFVGPDAGFGITLNF